MKSSKDKRMDLNKLNRINAAEYLCFNEDCIPKTRAQPRDIDCKDENEKEKFYEDMLLDSGQSKQ